MHQSAIDHMTFCVDTYMDHRKNNHVVDFGSRVVSGQKLTHRAIFEGRGCSITGVDLEPGLNVDVVMTQPYSIPLPSNIADIVISGQVFEHIPYFWVSFLEMARILKPNGHIFLTAPSRGHIHSHPYDCWRFYPDGYKALAKFSGLELRHVHADFPPKKNNRRFDYSNIESNKYWGDTVGVFQKTSSRPSWKISTVRGILKWWANQNGNL